MIFIIVYDKIKLEIAINKCGEGCMNKKDDFTYVEPKSYFTPGM